MNLIFSPGRNLALGMAGLLLATAMLAACAPLANLAPAVEARAKSMDQDFRKIREANDALVREVNQVYSMAASLEFDLSKLETPEGGSFRIFGDNLFYSKTVRTGSCYYYCPGGKAPSPEAKRELMIMSRAEDAQTRAWLACSDIATVVFFGISDPADIAQLQPWNDVVSVLPPGLRLTMFEWYNRGLGAVAGSVWVKEPFVDLTTGWTMDVAGRVDRGGGKYGATVVSVNIDKFNDKHLSRVPESLVLLSRAGVVMGTSPSAARLLGVEGLNIDILEKSRLNRFVTKDYLLGGENQTALAKTLASMLASGGNQGEFTLEGKTRAWISVPIPETGCSLVGITD